MNLIDLISKHPVPVTRFQRPYVIAEAGVNHEGSMDIARRLIDEAVYGRTANDALINIWSDNEVYLSRGFALSFLHSVPELFPEKPEGYDARAAQTLLESFPDEDIPEGEKVAVMGVMLEALCDLTDFDALAGFDTVQ